MNTPPSMASEHYEQVPLSGFAASLLGRRGRMLYVMPKSTGLDSFNLSASPFPTTAYRYVGFVNELPASYAASASLHHGTCSEIESDFSNNQVSANNLTRSELIRFQFGSPSCLFKQPSVQRRAVARSERQRTSWCRVSF